MIGTSFPRFSINLSPNLDLPTMVSGRFGETRGSCATGYDRSTRIRSAGEAIERLLSFSELQDPACYRCLSELEPTNQEWFRALFKAADQHDLEEHRFACEVVSLHGSDASCLVPTLPFTLGPHPDSRFMPIRDSSGCAIHVDRDQAKRAALAEFAERQALCLFWYYGHVVNCCEIAEQPPKHYLNASSRKLLSWFRNVQQGKIYLFDISVLAPFHSFLAFYVNEQGPVYFATGAAGSDNAGEAINKAIMELYQAFVLTFQNVNTDYKYTDIQESTDSITAGYLQYNTQYWADEFQHLARAHLSDFPSQSFTPPWRRQLLDSEILIFDRQLDFGPSCQPLTFIATMGMPSFPLMSIENQATTADQQAAKYLGYEKQVRTGPIPFA